MYRYKNVGDQEIVVMSVGVVQPNETIDCPDIMHVSKLELVEELELDGPKATPEPERLPASAKSNNDQIEEVR